ncbi:YdcF family protein [Paenibacillus sp. BK720]|uniref:YdcF family protein n=1 Tax=Paenibacillus sp. BK720 TaxID=2587092 RepID=UPI001422EC55|nr:YdcF family protein [Paenibacillus sp. BK720]NIK72509.1 vancomycin permeability regulator SanA [Paenibacillus sp. BK720]
MLISQFDPENLLPNHIDSILFNNLVDDGSKGDVIFVFGSQKSLKYRVPEVIKLHKQNRAPIILFSGGHRWDGQSDVEAKLMREEAIKQGIPKENILIEPFSKYTKENVICSSEVLESSIGLANVKRILIVTTAYHMRRCHLTMKTFLPDSISYIFCPVNDMDTRRDTWSKNEIGTTRVREECKKLITYIRNKQLIDFDVELS